jgi:hypothetical protein
MLADEAPEPLAQRASLFRNLVQFTGPGPRSQHIQGIGWNKPRLSQPFQEAVAAAKPVDRDIDRCRDRVHEIETGRVGNEDGRRSWFHDWTFSQQNVPIE